MLIPANDLPCPDKPCQTYPGELNSLIHQCDQLENDLLEAQASRNELGALASRYAEQLDEEVVNRGIVELALNQNKEALKEKIKELEEAFRLIGEKDQVIETQNFLLMYAWEDNQNLVAARRELEQKQKMSLSQAQLGEMAGCSMFGTDGVHMDKKRKFDR